MNFIAAICVMLLGGNSSLNSEAKQAETIQDEQPNTNRESSLNTFSFLILVSLLTVHVLTAWFFSLTRIWFIHPTGLALAYGEFYLY